MAEVKNAFIQSKMNKDLDDRLLPSGQYRNAVNAQVSKSEGSDVGALENVLGNALIADFTPIVATATVSNVYASIGIGVQSISGSLLAGYKVITNNYINNITAISVSNTPPSPITEITFSSAVNFSVGQVISFAPNLSSIGYLSDEFSNSIYIFLTDNTTNSYVPSGPGSNHYIYKYNADTNSFTKLVEGAFLNFSKLNLIFGVNLLEDLLFWTDNRNQPRKINVNLANSNNLQNPTYYTSEDQISVAKYYPHRAINLYEESSLSLEDYETTMKDVVSKALPNGGSANCVDITASSAVPITDLSIPIYPNEPLLGFTIGYIDATGNLVKLDATVASYSSTNDPTVGTITLSGPVTIPLVGAATELVLNFNPYYENNYSGDNSFLEDKFVRFSYRFKFDDGEYSLIAPFTQVCFIPKQDGYFLNTTLEEGDQTQGFESTIVEFMENKVNKIDLHIPLPCEAQDLFSGYHITEVDIVYKESDGLALQVVESVPIDVINNSSGKATTATSSTASLDLSIENLEGGIAVGQYVTGNGIVGNPVVVDFVFIEGSTTSGIITLDIAQTIISGVEITIGDPNFFTYIYKAQKPYKTLPSDEVTRVYDKVPVKALAQEIISNRIVYGNFLSKSDPPAFLDYRVAATEKSAFNIENDTTSIVEYPNSSLKTNRNYQVGVVLADRFGRQSTVILSNNKETITVAGISYSGSTLYSPYINEGVNESAWPGNSLKLLFNNVVPIDKNENYPGVYNDDINSASYNPLGWYSYKIVVKQNEQDYYNIYTAGALKGDPYRIPGNLKLNTSYIPLYSDNINKVPRDLSEVGPTQSQFRSSVRLFGRVENLYIDPTNIGNKQFYPDKLAFSTSSIQNLFDTFDYDDTSPIDETDTINVIYNAQSNPLVGQITTSQNALLQFGVINVLVGPFRQIKNLAIFETNPTVSRLEIFWETSTSGIISELNTAIAQDNNSVGLGFENFDTSDFDEGIALNSNISTTNFALVDFFGAQVPSAEIDSLTLNSVFNTESNSQNNTTYFHFYQVSIDPAPKTYNIKTTQEFLNNVYYGGIAEQRIWNFNFTSVVNGVTSYITRSISLKNLPPVIITPPGDTLTVNINPETVLVTTLEAVNGANNASLVKGQELSWQIHSITRSGGGSAAGFFSLEVSNTSLLSTCLVKNELSSSLPIEDYTLVIRVTDGGGAYDELTLTIKTGVAILPGQVTNVEIQIAQEDQYGYIFYDFDYVVFIEVTESSIPSQNGLYMYSQAWGNLGQGGGLVTIDYTNAVDLQSSCPNSSAFWAFTNEIYENNKIDMVNDFIYCYYTNIVSISFTETVVDTTNNTFVII
jgi:hypothetical protein